MISAIAAEKHEQTFEFLDANRNGYLQRPDFEAIADRLAAGASAADGRLLRDAYLRFWRSLADWLGIDDTGRISREQYIQGIDTVAKSTPNGFDYFISQMPSSIMIMYDNDGDGYLSRTEFLAMQAALGVPEDRAQIALLALDRDADGMIGVQDFLIACREFVLSDDPHARGNWLFGGLKPPSVRPY